MVTHSRDRYMYAALGDDIELLYVCCIVIIVGSPLAGHCHQTLSKSFVWRDMMKRLILFQQVLYYVMLPAHTMRVWCCPLCLGLSTVGQSRTKFVHVLNNAAM